MKKIFLAVVMLVVFLIPAFAGDGAGPYAELTNYKIDGGIYALASDSITTSQTARAMYFKPFRVVAIDWVAELDLTGFTSATSFYVMGNEVGVTSTLRALVVTRTSKSMARIYTDGPTATVEGLIIGW